MQKEQLTICMAEELLATLIIYENAEYENGLNSHDYQEDRIR